ncbi:MAG: UV DNA damage repair endonuclease UvsE [Chloroflexota bacterium]|nr:UV DNA damage repair endonuclease UvsE [Chloroflexota bacterium]
MRFGYPCSNLTLEVSASRTFRLASYSDDRLIDTVTANLEGLQAILEWNRDHDIRFFRISSTTVPFASHPVMSVNWQEHFADQLARIGQFITQHDMRINVHPGQYILLNSPRVEIVERSIDELAYHADLLDLMKLDATHKIQIHTGGVYGERCATTARFIERYRTLPDPIRARLVIENDERQYSLADNLRIHDATGVPLLFDVFHHQLFNHGEPLDQALPAAMSTWRGHGVPMVDYSSQHSERQSGAHTMSIDLEDFAPVAALLHDREVDVMLEIKDKEGSVLKAMAYLSALTAQPGMVGAD